MAVLAKAEKALLMAEKLKGDDSDSESRVGDKRTFEKA